MLGCSMTILLGLIDNEINLKFGESAVIGCGGVGLNLIQGLKMKEAHEILVDVNESLGDMGSGPGFDYFLYNVDALQHVDVVIDTTGNPSVIGKQERPNQWSFDSCGTTTEDGNCNSKFPVSMFEGSGKTIKATQGGMTNPTVDIPRYIDLGTGKLDYESIHTHTYAHWMK